MMTIKSINLTRSDYFLSGNTFKYIKLWVLHIRDSFKASPHQNWSSVLSLRNTDPDVICIY